MSQRRTLPLDDDVAALLDAEAQRKGVPAEEVGNEALRKVLDSGPANPLFPKAQPMGLLPGLSLENVDALLDEIEGPSRR